MHITALSVHLPSISDEPDGNDADDDKDDVAFLTKKYFALGKCCYACADTCLPKLQNAK